MAYSESVGGWYEWKYYKLSKTCHHKQVKHMAALTCVEIYKVLILLLVTRGSISLSFNEMGAFANVMSDRHFLNALLGVPHCLVSLPNLKDMRPLILI